MKKSTIIHNIRNIVIEVTETPVEHSYEKELLEELAYVLYLSQDDVTEKGRRTLTIKDMNGDKPSFKNTAIGVLNYLKSKGLLNA